MKDNSVILHYRSTPDKMSKVLRILEKSGLPVKARHEDKVITFYYADGTCDGNTQFHLEAIVQGLIALYKTS